VSSLLAHHPLEALRARRFHATDTAPERERDDPRTEAARRIRQRDRAREATSVAPPRPRS
jgi:hypothetical protein